jgi:hypothetical protein
VLRGWSEQVPKDVPEPVNRNEFKNWDGLEIAFFNQRMAQIMFSRNFVILALLAGSATPASAVDSSLITPASTANDALKLPGKITQLIEPERKPCSDRSLLVADGGQGSGGGNGLKSSPDKVAQVIRDYLNGFIAVNLQVAKIGLSNKAPVPIRMEPARSLLSSILKLENVVSCKPDAMGLGFDCKSVLQDHPELIEIKMTGACEEKGEPKDASVKFHLNAKGSPVLDSICFSAELLARYPDSEIADEVAALTFHEFSHVAGNEDEEVATQFQKYIRKKLRQDCTVDVLTGPGGNYWENDTYRITIHAGILADVSHLIHLPSDPSNRPMPYGNASTVRLPTRDATIRIETSNYYAPEFSFAFTPEKGGKLTFISTDPNGLRTINTLNWSGPGDAKNICGPNCNDPFDVPFYKFDQVTRSNATYNGKSVQAVRIDTGPGCIK